MKKLLTAIAVFVSSFDVLMAKEDNKIVCEGTYNRHLQGVATDGSNIWWSFTDEIVRTDKKGKVLKSVKAVSHQGDCCYVNGKLYVAVNLGKFNTEDKADSWVYCFDGNTLELENKWNALIKCGCLASEMEASSIYAVATALGAKASCVLHAIWNKDREKQGCEIRTDMDTSCAIKTAIEAVKLLIKR